MCSSDLPKSSPQSSIESIYIPRPFPIMSPVRKPSLSNSPVNLKTPENIIHNEYIPLYKDEYDKTLTPLSPYNNRFNFVDIMKSSEKPLKTISSLINDNDYLSGTRKPPLSFNNIISNNEDFSIERNSHESIPKPPKTSNHSFRTENNNEPSLKFQKEHFDNNDDIIVKQPPNTINNSVLKHQKDAIKNNTDSKSQLLRNPIGVLHKSKVNYELSPIKSKEDNF